MNRIKDKLAESVRQARSAPAPKAHAQASPKPARKAAAGTGAPLRPQPGPRGASPQSAHGEPPASSGTLFPERVWPD